MAAFPETFCSQCGGAFGPGDHGYSHCDNHRWERGSSDERARVALETAREALDECEDYFDKRQDADCDQDGFIPNEEMRLLSMIGKALAQVDAALAKATGGQP